MCVQLCFHFTCNVMWESLMKRGQKRERKKNKKRTRRLPGKRLPQDVFVWKRVLKIPPQIDLRPNSNCRILFMYNLFIYFWHLCYFSPSCKTCIHGQAEVVLNWIQYLCLRLLHVPKKWKTKNRKQIIHISFHYITFLQTPTVTIIEPFYRENNS